MNENLKSVYHNLIAVFGIWTLKIKPNKFDIYFGPLLIANFPLFTIAIY